MSERPEPVERLDLVGYEKLTDHGFALPVFGQSQGANVFYAAHSSSPGQANAQIAAFDHYEPDQLTILPPEKIRQAGVGEPWLDVFLWEGSAYVGTALQIWDALREVRAAVEEHAPMSLLALAEGIGDQAGADELARKAFSWMTKRYGKQKALDWRRETYFRGVMLKTLRRELGVAASRTEKRRALQEEIVVQEDDNKLTVSIGSRFSFVDRSHIDLFTKSAASVGLSAEFIIQEVAVAPPVVSVGIPVAVPKRRTSESEMRVAALQVAASKPNGKATTTELKNEVGRFVTLTTEDRILSETRPSEAMYQQIVGNIVSHRESKTNIFARGWATYTGDGIQITDAGRQHLRMLGLKT